MNKVPVIPAQAGIYKDKGVLDEIPGAYTSINEVRTNQADWLG